MESELRDALKQIFQQCRSENGFITASFTMCPPSLQIIVVNKLFPVAQKFVTDPCYLGFPVVVKEWQEMWPD